MKEQKEKLFFPVFVDLSEKHIVVFGAGKIAERRIRTLLDFAGRITVIAPEIREGIQEMKTEGGEGAPAGGSFSPLKIEILERPFQPEDLKGADLVLALTGDHELNERIGKLCKERGIPVNVSHKKELCDFYFPGVVRKENVVIGVTASGKDHAEAKTVTEQIRSLLD